MKYIHIYKDFDGQAKAIPFSLCEGYKKNKYEYYLIIDKKKYVLEHFVITYHGKRFKYFFSTFGHSENEDFVNQIHYLRYS